MCPSWQRMAAVPMLLLRRASVALGEAPSSHSAAAEISKASMNAAKKEAEGLKNMLSEVEFLEHQQNKLQHLREAQKAREMAVSTAKQQQEAQSELHRLPSTARGTTYRCCSQHTAHCQRPGPASELKLCRSEEA